MENNSCLIYTDFLSSELNAELYQHVLTQQHNFGRSKVYGKDGLVEVDAHWRNSVSLAPKDFAKFYTIFKDCVNEKYLDVAEKLGMEPFKKSHTEVHLTSHNDGEFFKPHTDKGKGLLGRMITFVYYFHSIPKEFSGGQLLFLHNKPKPLIVEPANNTIVFFDSSLVHAVHPVSCPGAAFESGRFTINGWVWKKID